MGGGGRGAWGKGGKTNREGRGIWGEETESDAGAGTGIGTEEDVVGVETAATAAVGMTGVSAPSKLGAMDMIEDASSPSDEAIFMIIGIEDKSESAPPFPIPFPDMSDPTIVPILTMSFMLIAGDSHTGDRGSVTADGDANGLIASLVDEGAALGVLRATKEV
jgi:hypothetical protein